MTLAQGRSQARHAAIFASSRSAARCTGACGVNPISGGWLDGHTLRAEVIFLETPHRMDITCSLPGRTGQAVWRHPPLAPSKLQHPHCPG